VKSLLERFEAKVNKNGPAPEYRPDLGPCWLWTANIGDGGYGRIRIGTKGAGGSRLVRAHRVAYQLFKGPIPDGLEPDHLCRVRHCVNPGHLEAVTHRVNTLRGEGMQAQNARKTHCSRGHELSGDNLVLDRQKKGARLCRTCRNQRQRDRRLRVRQEKMHG
jgi:hypothetical protein